MSAQEVSASRDWLGARRAACKSEDYPRTGLRKVERTGARAGGAEREAEPVHGPRCV